MASISFTDRHIRNIKPTPAKQFDIYDSKMTGLGLRVSPGGAKSFFVFYRIGGLNRRLSLGRFPTLSLAIARQRTQEALRQVAAGQDPAAEKISARDAYRGNLFPVVLESFIENHAKRKTRSWQVTDRLLRREFANCWRNLPIGTIKRQHVNSVLDEIVNRGSPSAANHAFAAVRGMFNWCVERSILDNSPCFGMRPPSKSRQRDRVLTDNELVAVWKGAEKLGYPFGHLIHLLILTGQRRDEVSSLRWSDLDLAKGIWTLPADRNKSGRKHIIPLCPPAIVLISNLPRVNAELLFPARGRNNPVSGFSKWKARLDALCGVSNWTIHDLRRTVATRMAELMIAPHVIERVLNHQLGGVAAVYNRHGYLPEIRHAFEVWAEHVSRLIGQTHDERLI